MYDELMFTACNIKRQVEKLLKEVEPNILGDMNDDNKKGYDFGVKTIFSLLENVISAGEDGGEVLVNKTDLDEELDYEELDLHDLLEMFDCRVIAERK